MNPSDINQLLKEFSITKLHGERNVRITFDSHVKILVAENGYGKTTILNSLFALIYGKYEKLRSIDFESIGLKFSNGRDVYLVKSDFSPKFDHIPQTGMLNHFRSIISNEQLANVYEDYKALDRTIFKKSASFLILSKETNIRFNGTVVDDNLIQWLEMLNNELGGVDVFSDKLRDARTIIREAFPFDPIYLPTYRRIEEDLKNLTSMPVGNDIERTVIQFGMDDVQANFDLITAEIKDSSIEWFAKVSGQMLGQLIKGFDLTSEMKLGLDDKEALRIVLERIGDNMPFEDKGKILQLIESKEILGEEYQPLAYFLANLVKVYEQQKANDNAIRRFTERCNRYLFGKKVVYDESSVEISIRRKKNDKLVSINTLSSGEKQIISLFSRLFLTKSKDVAIFFDEPELSLSIEWQQHLLPDILDSGICAFLICMTHSPFIFENELAEFTSGLDQYIEEL